MASPNTKLTHIYNNLFVFMEYRGLRVTDTSKQLDDAAFIKFINTNDYIVVNCVDAADKQVFIVLFHHSVQTTFTTQDFKKVVSKIAAGVTKGNAYDIIMITKTQLSTHVTNFVNQLNQAKNKHKEQACPLNHEQGMCICFDNNVYAYTYANFIIQIPKHVLVPDYRVLSIAESKQVLDDLLGSRRGTAQVMPLLPHIKLMDPMVIWSTATRGNLIEITRCRLS